MPSECDVLIVGFGPVGATIATLLGGYGVRTLVVDKAIGIFMAPRAIALDNEALRILQLVGVKEGDFETLAIPRVVMRSPQAGQFGCINMAGSIDGHPKLVTFYQPDLERVLRERLAAQGCVRTASGCELIALDDQSDSAIATLRVPGGATRTVKARFVVGADGASSKVRQILGQEFMGQTYSQDWLIVDARRPDRAIEHVEFICDPARPVPHMPAPGGRERWEFMLKPGETREQMETDERIHALLAPWGDTAEMDIERRAVYRFHARVASTFRKGNVFLAGDAAHITPPFVGQGLVAGLRDAANLSWKLAWVIKGRASERILDSYDTERRPHACAMINLARLMGRLIMPGSPLVAWLIHGLMRQLQRIPWARRYLDELGIKPRNRFARGLFVNGRSRSSLVRGGMLPQGWLRSASGQVSLSDDVLGTGLALVGFGSNPSPALSADSLAAFAAAGGRILEIGPRGSKGAEGCFFEDIDNTFIPTAVPHGWAAIVRPDRTLLHDGPIEEVTRLVRESLQQLGPQPRMSSPTSLPLARTAP